MTTFDPPYYVIPGVIETLINLQQKGYKLHILTIGLESIQRRKLYLTELQKFFDEIHIVPYDKEAELIKIADKYGKDKVLMVGNSMRSDINPALKAGVNAMYIPKGSWHNFKAAPEGSNYLELSNIEDLINIL